MFRTVSSIFLINAISLFAETSVIDLTHTLSEETQVYPGKLLFRGSSALIVKRDIVWTTCR